MTTLARQPFAPLDGARLQVLTSLKNRQNAAPPAASKRKASELTDDDFENVDPSAFAKRPKGSDGTFFLTNKDNLKPSVFYPTKDSLKASAFFPTKDSLKASTFFPTKDSLKASAFPTKDSLKASAFPTKDSQKPSVFLAPRGPRPSPAPRSLPALPRVRSALHTRSPISKLSTSAPRPSPLSAPAGRSPTRARRSGSGITSRRRTAGPYSRVDPPSFNVGPAVPFSLDAALKGTIPGYAPRIRSLPAAAAAPVPAPAPAPVSSSADALLPAAAEMKDSWFFDIHEDTPDQELTNLLQHGTCILDISSDEESARRAAIRDGRDKENVPPADDVSQTSSRRLRDAGADEMVVEKERLALSEMDVKGFYAAGCDASSVVLVPADEEGEGEGEGAGPEMARTEPETEPEAAVGQPELTASDVILEDAAPTKYEAAPKETVLEEVVLEDVEALMARAEDPADAGVLGPMEGTGESFVLWESGSARGEGDAASPAPVES